uniref:Uncharacterized protein n=1 Tax=Rhizophora mucronata TaxID=61149 RepID=A0A2P2PQU4_RHIMU
MVHFLDNFLEILQSGLIRI